MEYRQLVYFAKIAETGSFSRAAEALYVSQPALSKQILDLEREFDVQLFVRGKQRVTLTEKGKKLLPEAKAAVSHLESAEQILRGNRSDDGRRVFRIGVEEYMIDIPTVRKSFLAAEAALRKAYPELLTDLIIRGRDELESRCLTEELDVALVTTHELKNFSGLRCEVFIQSPMCCYYKVSAERVPEDNNSLAAFLGAHTLLHLNDNPSMLVHVSRLLGELGAHPRQIVSNGLSVALTQAQRGEGILLLPEVLLRNEVPGDLRVTHLDKNLYPLYYVSLWQSDSPELRFFIRSLQIQTKITDSQ